MNYNNLIKRTKDDKDNKDEGKNVVKTFSGNWEDLTEEQQKEIKSYE